MNTRTFHEWLNAPRPRPLVMGILNVTPDSFSDGGKFLALSQAADHALQMIAEGADLLDIGGESTRPGAARASADEQIERIVPVIERIRRESDIAISVDTTLAPVLESAADAGASLLNDISAGREDATLLTLAANRGLPVVLMHMLGEPRTMQLNPVYQDVTREVRAFLLRRAEAARLAGVPAKHILIDPGIGFGKTTEHNLQILHDLDQIADDGYRVLLGTSRKRFIGAVTQVAQPAERAFGTTATVAWGICHGASIVRVHDVAATVQTVKMIQAIRDSNGH